MLGSAMILNVNEPETRGTALALQTMLDDVGKGARGTLSGMPAHCCFLMPGLPLPTLPPFQAWAPCLWHSLFSGWAALQLSTSALRAGYHAACCCWAPASRWQEMKLPCNTGLGAC